MAFHSFAMPGARAPKVEKKRKARDKDATPASWQEYFDASEDVAVDGSGTFRVYHKGAEGPQVVLLHGGGHSSLVWALFAEELVLRCKVRVVAIDFRAHGATVTDNDSDLSCATLCADILAVIQHVHRGLDTPITLVGHSLGGAIATHLAASRMVPHLTALVVIDVVEGSALEALAFMRRFLATRPQLFDSVQKAVQWSVSSGQLRHLEAARISLPDQLKPVVGKTAAAANPHALLEEDEEEEQEAAATTTTTAAAATTTTTASFHTQPETTSAISSSSPPPAPSSCSSSTTSTASASANSSLSTTTATAATEKGAEGDAEPDKQEKKARGDVKYTWRVDLEESEPYWQGWFEGISSKYLSSPVSKLLLLAAVDRLDKELTIAQMQGKFQLQVFQGAGHSIHEDAPERVADAVAGFLTRMRIASPQT